MWRSKIQETLSYSKEWKTEFSRTLQNPAQSDTFAPQSLKLPPCARYQERREERLRAPGLQEQEKEPDNWEGKEGAREGAGREGDEGRRMSHSFSEAALHEPVATVKENILNCTVFNPDLIFAANFV